MSHYTQAPACQMLSTHCVCCGRELLDATSVQLGVGPECRRHFGGGIPDSVRQEANKLVLQASIAASAGRLTEVFKTAAAIRALGLDKMADKVAARFRKGAAKPSIIIDEYLGQYRVKTPFCRKRQQEFTKTMRAIPGRRYTNGYNLIPRSSKRQLWAFLCEFFPGAFGKSTSGMFRVPMKQQAGAPVKVQGQLELNLRADA